jgi:endonuclease/exonuclease/phosphatase family metal-dependent hydrolase
MRFRVATLNLEQDHKRWEARRALVAGQLAALRPDVLALNEVCLPKRTAHWLRDAVREQAGIDYHLVQQTRVNGLAALEGEALLTRFPVLETGNLDYRTRDFVALVARLRVGSAPVDVYVTHLYASRGDDALRLHQVQQLLAWIDGRDAPAARLVCGDFNATLDMASAGLMATRYRPTQTAPTAFTPLAGPDGEVTHPDRARMDRCIDFIWMSEGLRVHDSRVCFNQPSAADATLWPSDHAGVFADLELQG